MRFLHQFRPSAYHASGSEAGLHHVTSRRLLRAGPRGALLRPARHFAGGGSQRLLRVGLRMLRLRYLALYSAVGGTYVANKRYEQLKEACPDFGALKPYLPTEEQLDSAVHRFRQACGNVVDYEKSLVQSIKSTLPLAPFKNLSSWMEEAAKQREAEEATERRRNLTSGSSQRAPEAATVRSDATAASVFSSGEAEKEKERKRREAELHGKVSELQEELMKLQFQNEKEKEKMARENRELRRQISVLQNKGGKSRQGLKKSLIDMYSEVLDELSDYDSSYSTQDSLPRVVVVGDQSSGKTSVLEMIAEARIFPRGSGEMMTRSPVQVTLSEGPYHVAKFKDSTREFDLTKESELEALRAEIELRMRSAVRFAGGTISTETIALSVQGPGLQRMVLVDLPGIISTETSGMAENTRESIRGLARHHMENPNAIILCIQDGSVDAERSNVTDLVSSMDPHGRRTIFVLTKVDLAETALHNPQRIKQILSGKLFPMKALGYFAVVTGRGNQDDSIQTIKEYEETFFKKSRLFKDGIFRSQQTTTGNLSRAVSNRFWKMVQDSVAQQADAYKASRYNLETEWKNKFPNKRELDRLELFEKARSGILDEIISLGAVTPKRWECILRDRLWASAAPNIFESIILPAAQSGSNLATYQTLVDIRLKQWADSELPVCAVDVGAQTLYSEFRAFTEAAKKRRDHDKIFDNLKDAVLSASFERHRWDAKADNSLRVVQATALDDRTIHTKADWDVAVRFMESSVRERLRQSELTIGELKGPSASEQWLHWKSRTATQKLRASVMSELEKVLASQQTHSAFLSADEVTAVRKNLQNRAVETDNDFIRETWHALYRRHFLTRLLSTCQDCRKGFYYYQKGFTEGDAGMDCREVLLFWRLNRVLEVTSSALRQQIVNNEVRRVEKITKEVLDEFAEDKEKLYNLLTDPRVKLAVELKRVRQIQEKLEEFIEALKND